MKRVFLFVITNLAVLLVLSVTLQLLGIDSMLDQAGGLNMTSLLIMAAVLAPPFTSACTAQGRM